MRKVYIVVIFFIAFVFSFNIMSKTKEPKSVIKYDTLPLENGSEIHLIVDNNEKVILMSPETFEYITDRKSRYKKVKKDLNALFARFE